jgi:hypothetical protein
MATDIQRLIEQIDALPPDDQARVRQAILATAAAPSPLHRLIIPWSSNSV